MPVKLSLKVKVAVEPVKAMVVTGLPLARRVTLVMSEGFPVPDTESVSPVTVTAEVEGLVKTTCCTATF